MFENWTRKMSAFALVVWAFAIVWYVLHINWEALPPTPAEWATLLMQIAISAGVLVAVAAGKSIGTAWVKSGNGKNGKPPTP